MIEAFLPIETVSEANTSEHWSRSGQRHRTQQAILRLWFRGLAKEAIPELPVEVTFIRVSARELDDDNLRMSFKWLRDELSEMLIPKAYKPIITRKGAVYRVKGRQDTDKRIKWLYGQEKGKIKGIRIRIESVSGIEPSDIGHEDIR